MNSKTILFYTVVLMFLSLDLFSLEHPKQEQEYYLYVSTAQENLKPNSRENGLSNDEALNQIFRTFGVVNYYQSFPRAKNIELQNYYEIHFRGNVDSLEKLLKERELFDAIYRSDICSSLNFLLHFLKNRFRYNLTVIFHFSAHN